MSPRPPDFNRLFAVGARHDFSHFRAGCTVTVRIAEGADLRLPSGRLIAHEPWAIWPAPASDYAFVQQVAPGSYPVELVMADFHDPGNPQGNTAFSEVAAARLVVRDEPVAVWRMALQPGKDDADLAEDEFYGYPVDGGMGAFCSPEFMDAARDNDDFEGLSDASMDVVDSDDVSDYLQENSGTNTVMFRSGGGDGHYGTWVGYTAAGEIACFVTDFRTLTAHDEDDGDEDEIRPAAPDPQDAKAAASYRDPEPPAPAASGAPVYRRRGPASRAVGAQMLVGQTLRRQSLTSTYGMCTLVYQDDGNLVLYRYDREWALWASNTQGASVGECVLQEDGNLVVYDRDGRAVWATGTNGRPAARLSVRDDGFAVLENDAGDVLWATDPVAAAGVAAASAALAGSAAVPMRQRAKVPGTPSRGVPATRAVPATKGVPARPMIPARPAVPRTPPEAAK
ncbi:MAG TPA: DUF4241 domain-containing protein [Actinocrinis sp.]